MRSGKLLFLLVLTLSALIGCQQEADVLRLPLPEEAFVTNSAAANLINRTTLLDGSADNILDSASCASLVLPVTVWVNGQEVIVNTTEDLKYIERIVDESQVDDDDLNIVFPVTVMMADHSTILVQDEDALEDIMDQCEEGGSDDDIECIDFIYPIKLSIYNTNNQTSEVITINDDEAMYDFIDALEESELASFTFPIVMQLLDGTEVTIQNNDELETAIENASDDCDEDDDNDFEDDDVDTNTLTTTLITGSWKVNQFFDESDQTSQFTAYAFTFNADGSAIATDGVTSVDGTWAIYGDNGALELVLDFGESTPFDEIKEDWGVIEFTDTIISLQDDSKALIFERL